MRMKLPIICVIALMMSSFCFASGDFYGTVAFSGNKSSAEGATVRLLDTVATQRYHSITDKKGKFAFKNVVDGKYTLYITFVGYKPIKFGYTVTATSKKNMGHFELEMSETTTGVVNVTAEAILGEMVGDTAQFNAGVFKVDSSAKVAELLNKIPGVEVDASGNIKAQGDTVTKVLVDGRKFFGDDPKVALENIPAKSIDKVQVYDKASDNDEFIGNDDDKDQKAINLVLKKEAKRGAFGDITAGGGTRDRYEGKFFTNLMDGKHRIATLGWINNTNTSGADMSSIFASGAGNALFSQIYDYDDFDLSDGSYMAFGSGSSIGGNGKIAKTSAAGINLNDDLWIFKKSNFTYFYKKRKLDNETLTEKEYLPISETSEVSESNSKGFAEKYYHYVSFNSDNIEISEKHAFKLSMNAEYDKPTTGQTSLNVSDYRNGTHVSDADNRSSSEKTGKQADGNIIYRYKFDKKGRTFGASYNINYNDDDGYSEQNSLINYYLIGRRDTLLQHKDLYSKNASNRFNVSATEPFGKYSKLSLDYTFNLNNMQNNVYSYDMLRDAAFDSTYSNEYKNKRTSNNAGLEYQFKKDKLTVTGGIEYRNTTLDGNSVLPYRYKVDYTAERFLPSLRVRYKLQDGTQDWGNSISLGYSTNMLLPQVSQLQEVLNNSNPLWLSIGNSRLKASNSSDLYAGFNFQSDDFKKSAWAGARVSITKDPICKNFYTAFSDTLINGISLVPGSHLTQLLNLDESRTYNVYGNIELPFGLIKGSSWKLNTSYNYTDNPSVINNEIYNGKNSSVYCGLGWRTTYSDKFQFNIDGKFSYHSDKNNSMGNSWKNEYRQYTLSSDIRWTFFKTAYIKLNSVNQFYSGSYYDSGDYNTNLLNGLIGAKFLKNKSIIVELMFVDILHDRKSISNTTSADYMTFSRKIVLENYVLLKVTYNFNTLGGSSSSGGMHIKI